MGNLFKSVAVLLGTGLLPVFSYAQKSVIIEDDEPNSIMFISRDKAGDDIITILNENQLPRFQDPKAPRFISGVLLKMWISTRHLSLTEEAGIMHTISSKWISRLPTFSCN